jgi:hypothetical protein
LGRERLKVTLERDDLSTGDLDLENGVGELVLVSADALRESGRPMLEHAKPGPASLDARPGLVQLVAHAMQRVTRGRERRIRKPGGESHQKNKYERAVYESDESPARPAPRASPPRRVATNIVLEPHRAGIDGMPPRLESAYRTCGV